MSFPLKPGKLVEPITGRQWHPRDVNAAVSARTASLLAAGVRNENTVLILFGNNLEFFAELLAIWNVGGCAIPVDARLTAFEIQNIAKTSGAAFAIVDDSVDTDILANLGNVEILHTHRDAPDVPVELPIVNVDQPALILFTSGTTGQPKGVVHSHRTLSARWEALRENLGTHAFKRTLCLLPTHFGHGLICNALYPWLSGCDLYIAPPFRPELVMRLGSLIDNFRITFMSSVPSMWRMALQSATPPGQHKLMRVHIGSAPLSRDLWENVQTWTGTQEVFNAYGITETGSWIAGTSMDRFEPESGLIGLPWGTEFRIGQTVDALTQEAGRQGMVWLRTGGLMQGYFQRPDLTAEVIQDGWFRTGDIGYLDESGYLYLKGRERDEINKGGMKIFPSDIDEVAERYELTADACAFRIDDEFYGEDVGIAVVLKDTSDEAALGLHKWLDQHLARHKHPNKWYLVDDIPRTSRGKINRDRVRAACKKEDALDMHAILRRKKSS